MSKEVDWEVNEIKNIDYDAFKTHKTSSSFDNNNQSSLSSAHRTRSLDIPSSVVSDRVTSFRIQGNEGEFDLICRQLGLDPDDFAVPAADYEAHRVSYSPRFSYSTPVLDWEVDEIIILKEDYDLSQLPDSPHCKNLLKLSIQVSGLTEIPPTFFEHMPLLEELDLSTTNIQSLPSSISSLTSLQKLFLRDCSVLMELPSEIRMLKKLKLLDCEGSEIMYIPKEIGELNDLEVLRVSLSLYADYFLKAKRVNDSVKIPRNILSKLNKLKELCITTCPEVEWWEEEVKEIQDDLCHLEYLETLKWYLPTTMVLDQFLQIEREGKRIYENLSNFTLTIGRHPQLTSCLPANLQKKFENFEKCLKWINAEGNEKDISMIMERAEALFLSRHWTIVRLSDFDLAKLKYCLLAECNEMETLVEIDELSEGVENIGTVGLESIEYLTVHDMEKFQSIWKGPMGKDSLSRLRILALHTCPNLTTIFTIYIAQNLSRLTELTVEDCPNVTSLVNNESPNIATGPLFPCLEKIFLLDLPELDSIFRGKIILEKVDSLLVYNCLKLQRLSVTELPNIQKIKGEKEWWNDLKCDKSRWQNVFEQLKEERHLIEQLAEATNSLQHFHDILSRDAKDEKPPHRSSLGVSETKGHTSSFPIGEQEGLSLSQPARKMSMPGDWKCRSCQHLNFQRRDSCQRCREVRLGAGGMIGSFGGRGIINRAAFGFAGPDVWPDDWYCNNGNCGAHNFASRSSCFRCGAFKDDLTSSGGGVFDGDMSRRRGFGFGGGSAGGSSRPGWKSGDWICTRPGCNEHNFGSRMECFRCNAPREARGISPY